MILDNIVDAEIGPGFFGADNLGPGLANSPVSPLEQWSAAAGMLCAPGCEAQTFFLLSSFAAPLMSLWKTTEGGAVVAIHGGRKSGKTAAEIAAATIWGSPGNIMAPLIDQRATALPRYGNLPVICEKMLARDPATTRRFLVAFAQGARDRAWQTIVMGATPYPLFKDVMQPGDSMPGVDIPVSVPKMLIDPLAKNQLENVLISARGHAGVAYLQYISRKAVLTWCRSQMYSVFVELGETYGEEARFARRAIAAAHVAARIVQQEGILDVQAQRITDWVVKTALEKVKPL